MPDVVERLRQIGEKIDAARRAAEDDTNASPVTVAVVREFANKAEKALRIAGEGRDREAVIELEQAGDSAKAAAEADTSAAAQTTEAVLDAHLAICKFKVKLDQEQT